MRTFVWHDVDSFLQRLNPLTKLALTVPVTVLVASTNLPQLPLVTTLILLLATRWLGRLPWSLLLRPLGFALLLSLGTFWSNALFYAGAGSELTAPAVWLGPVRVSQAGLIFATAMGVRLLAIFASSMLFVLTTDPTTFVMALMQQARLPARIGYAVFAAYRFLPLLQEEFVTIQSARRVRGVDEGGGLIGWARRLGGVAIPLLAISVRRAERLALAMDARAFGALPQRSFYRVTGFSRADGLFIIGAGLGLVGLIGLRVLFG